jgi:hypothetical protein
MNSTAALYAALAQIDSDIRAVFAYMDSAEHDRTTAAEQARVFRTLRDLKRDYDYTVALLDRAAMARLAA